MDIRFARTKAEAEEALRDGYEPVECCFGEDSVVGPLTMDHHGGLSKLEGVALRAYRDHFGARKSDQRFVVTGAADADACFCVASLAGLLPHPSRETELAAAPPPVKASGTRNLTELAEIISQVDVAPIGVRLEESAEGTILLLWNQLGSSNQDSIAFYAGVDRWRALLGRSPKALLEATKTEEANRVTEARQAKMMPICSEVALVESKVWGFDVWYAETAPVIVAFVPQNGNITLGVRDLPTAEALFGPGGLKNVFPKLEPAGWGGRETVGGSPRGAKFSSEQALEVALVIAGCLVS